MQFDYRDRTVDVKLFGRGQVSQVDPTAGVLGGGLVGHWAAPTLTARGAFWAPGRESQSGTIPDEMRSCDERGVAL